MFEDVISEFRNVRAQQIDRIGDNRVVVDSEWGRFRMRLQLRPHGHQWDIKIHTPEALRGQVGTHGIAIRESYSSINTLESHLIGIGAPPHCSGPPIQLDEDDVQEEEEDGPQLMSTTTTTINNGCRHYPPLTERQHFAGHIIVRAMRRVMVRRKLGERTACAIHIRCLTEKHRMLGNEILVHMMRASAAEVRHNDFCTAHPHLTLHLPMFFGSAVVDPSSLSLDSLISEPWSTASRDTLRAMAVVAMAHFNVKTNEWKAAHAIQRIPRFPLIMGYLPQAFTHASAWKILVPGAMHGGSDGAVRYVRSTHECISVDHSAALSANFKLAWKAHCVHMAAHRPVGVFDVFSNFTLASDCYLGSFIISRVLVRENGRYFPAICVESFVGPGNGHDLFAIIQEMLWMDCPPGIDHGYIFAQCVLKRATERNFWRRLDLGLLGAALIFQMNVAEPVNFPYEDECDMRGTRYERALQAPDTPEA